MHKQRPLVKPMVCVATENDACIMQQFLKGRPEAWSKFQNRDMFVVGRGFREAWANLEHKGFTVKIPEIISAGKSQLSDLRANRSRLVT